MEQVDLKVNIKESTSKTANRTLRREGNIPAIVYHRNDPSESVSLSRSDLREALSTEAGRNVLINLRIEGAKANKPKTVVVKEIQFHPVTGVPLHVDFHQVSLKEKITVAVPLVEKGEAAGVKIDGGVLEFPIREVEISCLPTEIPEHIDVDVTDLKLNQAIHVKDLVLDEKIETVTDPETVLVQVVPPHVEKEVEESEEGAQEPEVIGEKKDEEAEGEAKSE